MAGTAKNYDITKLHQGPADLWVIGGGVADSATPQVSLASDGTPDATAHPSSIHLGAFEDAVAAALTPKFEDIMIEQADGPVARYVSEVKLGIEVSLKQLDPSILQYATMVGTYASASGYKQLTFGGQAPSAMTDYCLALIAPKRAVAGKYVVAVIFKAQGLVGLQVSAGKAKSSSYKAQWMGLSDLTRVAGRQQGCFYETL